MAEHQTYFRQFSFQFILMKLPSQQTNHQVQFVSCETRGFSVKQRRTHNLCARRLDEAQGMHMCNSRLCNHEIQF